MLARFGVWDSPAVDGSRHRDLRIQVFANYINDVLRPLREREEPVYVIEGSRAERVATKLKGKDVRHVTTPIRNVTDMKPFPAPARARPPEPPGAEPG